MSPSRRAFLGASVTVGLAGCLSGFSPGSPDTVRETPTGEPTRKTTPTVDPADDPSLQFREHSLYTAYSHTKLEEEERSGGVPKDGIPSIDKPLFESPSAGNQWLRDANIVFGVAKNGVVRAYPRLILAQHEIVNDRLGGEPLSITYCPLTGTAMGFERGDTEFGVSGRLINNNLVMYDRKTDSRWPQITATAFRGQHAGKSLREFNVIWTTWGRWKQKHPDTEVLSRKTGFPRNYQSGVYGQYVPEPSGYYKGENLIFPPLAESDQYPRKHNVMGLRTSEEALVVDKAHLADEKILTVGTAQDILVVYDEQLDSGYAYRVSNPEDYNYEDGEVMTSDDRSEPGALDAEMIPFFDGMWFAWYGYYPDLTVHD